MAKANQKARSNYPQTPPGREKAPSLGERKVMALENIARSLQVIAFPVEMEIRQAQEQMAQQAASEEEE